MKKEQTEKVEKKNAIAWLKLGQFYIFGFVYMFARIALNTTATIMPFYISETLGYGRPEDPTFIPY